MKKVIIFGIGDLAKTLYCYMKDLYEVLGFCIDRRYKNEKEIFMGKKIFELEDILLNNDEDIYFIMAIGYKNMRNRKEKYLELKKKNIKFINFIHESVLYQKNMKIGENNIIFPGVILEPNVIISNNNIIWSQTLICHDSEIGNHNFIAAGTIIGGFSKILESNFIGFGAVISDNIFLEKEILIGSKSLVNKNPHNYSKYYGIPIKKISEHKKEGIKVQ